MSETRAHESAAGRPLCPTLGPQSQRILDLIRDRGLRPGDPMPTEQELIETLAVSRNSVREAVHPLRALGIVDIRRGHGTVVGEPSLRVLSPSLAFRAITNGAHNLDELRHLVEVRELIEVGTAERLVGEVDARTLERMTELCDEMTRCGLDPEVDREFHRELYSGVDNPLIGQLVDVFWDAYRSASAALTAPDADAAEHTIARHRAIVDALRDADAQALRDAMSAHFTEIKRRLDAGPSPQP